MLRKVLDSINALSRLHKAAEVITGLVIPVLIGLLATFQEKVLEISPFLFWATLALLAGTALVFTAISLNVKSAPEIYLEWQEERDANANITKEIQYGTLLEAESLAMNGLIRAYVRSRIASVPDLAEAIKNICLGFVEERNTYFNFESREMWNFAVYLWNPATSRLEPAWRERHRRHPSQGNGRTWGPNEGHIGHAFQSRKELITADAHAPEVAALMGAGVNSRPYDAQAYRSFVSEPILASDPAAIPYGVLVATSDRIGRFDPANSRVLKHAAVALATLIETAYDSP